MSTMPRTHILLVLILAAVFCLAGAAESFARVGGGRSMGSSGSRSLGGSGGYSSRPSSPSGGQYQQQQAPRPGMTGMTPGGSFMRSMAGGLAGGFLGAMLFRGVAGAGDGTGGMGGGPGLLDLIIIGLLLYLAFRWFKRRQARAQARPLEGQQAYRAEAEPFDQTGTGGGAGPGAPPGAWPDFDRQGDLNSGINHIRSMEPAFDPGYFLERTGDAFFMIQGAWTRRDINAVADLLTPEMLRLLSADAEALKAKGQVNRLENIAVRSLDLYQAWQESGQDYVTVHLLASLLDYTVEEKTGQVVAGSDREPVKFEELWTFTRPVGPGPWRLSAISQMN
ncbi:MAG: Tim44 domain-containing protein [Pseudomonadota bacterium]